MQKKKILINTPHLNKIGGGVTNHYLGLKPYWSNIVKYNYIGKRGENCFGPFWLPYDIVKFIFRIIIFNPDYIILNPSLNKRTVNRDKLFSEYPDLNIGLKSGKVINKNNNVVHKAKIRKNRFNDFRVNIV